MPLPTLAVPAYPFVPNAPGVPPLARAPVDVQAPTLLSVAATTGVIAPLLAQMLSGAVASMLNGLTQPIPQLSSALSAPPVATFDAPSAPGGTAGPQWGIFTAGGELAITPDSVVSFGFKGSYRLIKYPTEQGSFQTYNKVQVPFEVKVTMRKTGAVEDRQSFIDTLETIRKSLDLYSVATPEVSYDNLNISDVDYDRKAGAGATVIEPTITLEQINISASSSFTNVAQPSAAAATDGGTVDAVPPTSGQASPVPPGGPS